MNEIISMARKARLNVDDNALLLTYLTHFADLVRAAERDGMVADATKKGWAMKNEEPFEDCVKEIAEARARKENDQG